MARRLSRGILTLGGERFCVLVSLANVYLAQKIGDAKAHCCNEIKNTFHESQEPRKSEKITNPMSKIA